MAQVEEVVLCCLLSLPHLSECCGATVGAIYLVVLVFLLSLAVDLRFSGC